ncbi:MAG: 5-formyltetrahydrofolate cyclo-ligase [Microthrixaceae bacterium]
MTPPNPQPPSERDTAALRALIRARRRALGGSERRAAERTITALLVDVGELLCGPEQPGRPPLDVGWYLATDGEVDLGGVVDELRDRGHRLWLPVVGPDTTMRFRRWEPRTEMTTNRYGIPEPVASADDPTAERPASGLDVVIVPSVVLDRVGHRVGFGAGYYDRALADATVTTIGVGFAVQLVEELTPQPWDVTLDVVVTDEGVIRLGAT